jgi:hypothetical protein
MWKLAIGIFFLAVLALGAPRLAADHKKPKEQAATTADYKALQNTREIEGTLISLDPTTRRMTLKTGYTYLEPNPHFHPNSRANADFVRRMNKLIRQ